MFCMRFIAGIVSLSDSSSGPSTTGGGFGASLRSVSGPFFSALSRGLSTSGETTAVSGRSGIFWETGCGLSAASALRAGDPAKKVSATARPIPTRSRLITFRMLSVARLMVPSLYGPTAWPGAALRSQPIVSEKPRCTSPAGPRSRSILPPRSAPLRRPRLFRTGPRPCTSPQAKPRRPPPARRTRPPRKTRPPRRRAVPLPRLPPERRARRRAQRTPKPSLPARPWLPSSRQRARPRPGGKRERRASPRRTARHPTAEKVRLACRRRSPRRLRPPPPGALDLRPRRQGRRPRRRRAPARRPGRRTRVPRPCVAAAEIWCLGGRSRSPRPELPRAFPDQERGRVVGGVRRYRSEQATRGLEQHPEDHAREHRPGGPEQEPPVGADVRYPEDDGGDHDPELLLHGPAEEGLLPDAGEQGEEDEPGPVRPVDEGRGELLGELAGYRYQAVRQQRQRDGPRRGRQAQEQARPWTGAEDGQVYPAQAAPDGRRDDEEAVEDGGEADEAGAHGAATGGDGGAALQAGS